MNKQSPVRPYVIIMLVGTFCYLAVIGKINPEVVAQSTLMVVSFLFGERSALKQNKEIK